MEMIDTAIRAFLYTFIILWKTHGYVDVQV